ncbi:MAG: sodium:proline symporter [Candidatus Omnitrophica bacterium CG11_big_fil_rev_8_21_14_0_20_64_10]|nr:MAG: sodium:proline symporter [Candidatus Omnitrophica bacterium CG11_big_fil_rev_8_21_14_0_20_64_10]
MLLSFGAFLLVFIGIGAWSVTRSRRTTVDYLLAGRSVKPWLVGLSAVATNNSGYMFTGMIGFTYLTGWSSIWLMAGWLVGDLIGSLLIHHKLRLAAERSDSHSFSGVLSHWGGADYRRLRLIAGLLSLLFLGSYAAAQLNAGSKALHVLFGWELWAGAVLGAGGVLIYCLAGGIRASIWTDAAQAIVMLISMGLLLAVSVGQVGGVQAAVERLGAVQPGYLAWFPPDLPVPGGWGPFLFVAGWMFAGFGVVGQPHIMIRFMSLDEPGNLPRARVWYYGWFFLFYALTIGVGLMARLLLPEAGRFDQELALPMLSLRMLPPVWVGLILAGLFAATISTADSLVLSCSAALTRDLLPGRPAGFWMTKAGTFGVTAAALGIALIGNKSVFHLVLYSWAVLAAAFGPLLLVYCFGGRPSERLAITMVLAGAGVVIGWSLAGLSPYIYEIAPGILAGLVVYGFSRLFGRAKREGRRSGRGHSLTLITEGKR